MKNFPETSENIISNDDERMSVEFCKEPNIIVKENRHFNLYAINI